MKKRNVYVWSAAGALAFALASCGGGKPAAVADMRCEYMRSPVGIDAGIAPRFTWNYAGDDEDFVQTACRVRIASSRDALEDSTAVPDVWLSPEVLSGTGFVEYGGEALAPHTRYYWNIAVRDGEGGVLLSPIDSFETAKASREGWTARWITDGQDKEFAAAPMLRKSFEVKEGLREARLYASAAAYGKWAINGESASANRLDPGYTHYDKRNLYAVSDVTGLLAPGENVLSAVLGNGFYNQQGRVATWDFEQARWRDRPRMICELHLIYDDGSREVVASDGTWKTATGPYVSNNIYSGDTYDARREIAGWDRPGFDDASWTVAVEADDPSPLLVAQHTPAVQVEREIAPVAMQAFGDTVFVYDFGVNMSGVCRLSVAGEAGTTLSLKHGELLKDNGRVEMGNIDIYFYPQPGVEFQTDFYTLRGEGRETFAPDFTYHGFRYVEVKADRPVRLEKDDLTALFMHTAVEPAGSFSCSNELLNKIWAATNQAYLSNLMSIPTDCPQREKNGWTADAHLSVDLGLLNYDGIRFYEKWLDDLVDNQREDGSIAGIIPSSGWGYSDWIGPVWDAVMFIIPEALYNYYGDPRAIEKVYPVCEKYLAYLQNREDGEGLVTYGIGDWVPYKTVTPTEFTTPCFYYLDCRTMARFAELTGRDGTAYAEKADRLRETINRKYFHPDSATYANGSQAALATALALGIVPEGYEQAVADRLLASVEATDYHLDFGTLGSKYVLRMLARYGYADAAYKMAAQKDAPSWGAWIEKGFTTLAETWLLSPEFRDASVNHVFLGDVSAWMFNVLAGINYDPAEPGFRHIVFRPHFVEGLDWVKAEYRSVSGPIRSEWKREGKKIVLRVTVPLNTRATLYADGREIPVGAGEHVFRF